ncbi:substrate-binding domain-containing protein [Pseudovibrio exalbescens]|uniref:substrate-binding domain-containing protein n=1 Tax=Pseudovibrio exalbescens TaxID=197461 RepID=UPI002366D073|nr:substrate-binding domain-containing protein [Pseudovibrio exalbescens]MDD7911545.1 substrate-binding domain-containing protein [Pseudovibrio exalbescens]
MPIATALSGLAVVVPKRASYTVLGRALAFETLAKAEGWDVLKLEAGGQSYAGGLAAAHAFAEAASGIDGVFCVADYMALGFLDGLRFDHNVKVPEDLKVVGYDDIPQSSWKAYDLTTIAQSREELSEVTMRLLLDRLETPEAPPHEVITGVTLVQRGSTAG